MHRHHQQHDARPRRRILLVAFAAYNIRRLVKHLSQRVRPEVATDRAGTGCPTTSALSLLCFLFTI